MFVNPPLSANVYFVDNTGTSGESQHRAIKRHLSSGKRSHATIPIVVRKIEAAVLFQLQDIVNNETADRSHTPNNILPIFELIAGFVSWQAIRQCSENYKSALRNGTHKMECTGVFRRTMGLPCAHEWEVVRKTLANSGPPSFQIQDFHPFWLWSSKRQYANYQPWRLIPEPPRASVALPALSSMDEFETSMDVEAPIPSVVDDDNEEAIEQILAQDTLAEPVDISSILENGTNAWHQLVGASSAAISAPVHIPDTGIQNHSNNAFELERLAGQEEISSMQASQQDPLWSPPSPSLVTQPAKITENHHIRTRPTAQTGRILSQNEAIQREHMRSIIKCSTCGQEGHNRRSQKCPLKAGRATGITAITYMQAPELNPIPGVGRLVEFAQSAIGKLARNISLTIEFLD